MRETAQHARTHRTGEVWVLLGPIPGSRTLRWKHVAPVRLGREKPPCTRISPLLPGREMWDLSH